MHSSASWHHEWCPSKTVGPLCWAKSALTDYGPSFLRLLVFMPQMLLSGSHGSGASLDVVIAQLPSLFILIQCLEYAVPRVKFQ
eukprot:1151715-Pelagomonas_calceolata.AAC.2